MRCFSAVHPHLWGDEICVTQSKHFTGEGGEQGDPLMPMLHALGQHGALVAMQARLGGRVRVPFFMRHSLGDRPCESGCRACCRRGVVVPCPHPFAPVKPGAVVWLWNSMLPATQQGLKVLGISIGHEAFVQRFLESKTTEQEVLHRIPWVNNPQSAHLLLLMWGSTRARKHTTRTCGRAFVRLLARRLPVWGAATLALSGAG